MAKLKFEHSLILPIESIGSFLSLYLSIETVPSKLRRGNDCDYDHSRKG